jgi:UDP-glucose 4-epimerase
MYRVDLDRRVNLSGSDDLGESTTEATELLNEVHPDLCVINHSPASLAVTYARVMDETILCPVAVVVHAPRLWGDMLAHPMYSFVSSWLCVSREICEWMVEIGIPAEKVHYLPNLVDTRVFRPRNRRERDARWTPNGRITLGYVGRISAEKRPHLIVRAYRRVARHHPHLRLIMVGGDDEHATGPQAEQLQESRQQEFDAVLSEIRACSDDGVAVPMMTGGVSDVASWYRRMDALVLASRFEGLPFVALEGMACGLPLIAPDVGECRSLIGSGRGITCQESNDDGYMTDLLAIAFEFFVKMGTVPRHEMAEAARGHVVERYSTETRMLPYLNTILKSCDMKPLTAVDNPAPVPVFDDSRDGRPEPTSGQTWMVTGGCGFIGSTLIRSLVQQGHNVNVIDDLSTGSVDNISDLGPAVKLFPDDICNLGKVKRAAKGCEGIYHLAARVSVQRSFAEPERTMAVNVGGTRNVIEAAAGRRVVAASSSSVYGEEPPPQREEDAEEATQLSPYAVSKMKGDRLVREAGGCAMRFFNVYGPRQRDDSPYTGVIALFSRALLDGGVVNICGDGLQSRGFIYVSDVVRCLQAAMATPEAGGQAFNVGLSTSATVWDLYQILAEAVGETEATVEMVAARPGEIRHSAAVIDRARDVLGWEPRVELATGLRRALAWYRRR